MGAIDLVHRQKEWGMVIKNACIICLNGVFILFFLGGGGLKSQRYSKYLLNAWPHVY